MEDKELINESIKVSNILSKELSFWKKIFIVSNVIWLSLALLFGILSYIYFYNTETTIETITQEGIYNAKQYIETGNNSQLISSDLTNENIIKLMETMKQTNIITNRNIE